MTKQEVIDAYKYQFGGLVMDAQRNRTGTGSAQAADAAFAAIERWIGEIVDLVQPPKPAAPLPVKPAGNPPTGPQPGPGPGGPRPQQPQR